jgi:hypothetical protein
LKVWKRLSSCWSRGNSAGVDDVESAVEAVTVAMDVRSRRRSLQSLICRYMGAIVSNQVDNNSTLR